MNSSLSRACVDSVCRTEPVRRGYAQRIESCLPVLLLSLSLMIFTSAIRADAVAASETAATRFSDLVSLDGTAVSNGVSLDHGKWTLVKIWISNCLICQQQSRMISAFHEQRRDIDVVVVGIAMDGKDGLPAVNEYVERYAVSFPNLVGDMMQVMKQYEQLTKEPFRGTPTYLLFNRAGKLKGAKSGPITLSVVERFIERHDQDR